MARQITIDAIRAFNNNYKFKRSNTEVRIIGDYEQTQLRLHGNIIAYKDKVGTYINTCGYMTVTTKERLNGLNGVHIIQKDWVWYLNSDEWDGNLIKLTIPGYLWVN
jgi:hypothetical protein